MVLQSRNFQWAEIFNELKPKPTATSCTIDENWVMEMNITVSFTHDPHDAFSKGLFICSHLLCFLAVQGMCKSLQSEKKCSKESVFQPHFLLDCIHTVHHFRKDCCLLTSTRCPCTSSFCSGTSLLLFPEIDSVSRFQVWNCLNLPVMTGKQNSWPSPGLLYWHSFKIFCTLRNSYVICI